MKKLISVIATGAIFLSVASAALAKNIVLTNKNTSVKINALSLNNTGLNKQIGSGSKSLRTGDSLALTSVQSIANQNATGSLVDQTSAELKNKNTNVKVKALAVGNSGLNLQKGDSNSSLTTGGSGAETDVVAWANINLVGVAVVQ